jgi:hypothetical protein
MRPSNGIMRGACLSMALALVGTLGSPAPARAELGALIPAYFYPGTGGTEGYTNGWAEMAAAAGTIPITAIFNPASGPGGSVNSDYVKAITNLENAGGKVVAYIDTDYGAIPQATVLNEVNIYRSQYGSLIQGFFLDRMQNVDGTVSDPTQYLTYYHGIYEGIKGISPSYQVIGNPGTNTTPGYLAPGTRGADTLVTFEDFAANYSGYSPSPWTSAYSPDHFVNIIHDQTSVGGMMTDVNLAVQNRAGYVYVTDELLNPVPPDVVLYDRMPSYWNEEVAAIQAANAVPEPGPLTKLASGGLFAALAMAVQRWYRRRGRT